MTVYDRAQCMGYLYAILRRDTGTDFRNDQRRDDDLVEVAQTMRPTAYCLPTSVDLPLLRDVVVRMLGGLPAQRLRNDAGPLIRGILARTYPTPAPCATSIQTPHARHRLARTYASTPSIPPHPHSPPK